MQNEQHDLDQTNNPDSVLFVNNQFPKPYDALVGHDSTASNSASSSFFDNGYIDCIENEQPGVDDAFSPELIVNKSFSNQRCSKTQTYEIVENVVIEDIPSLLSPHLTQSHNYDSENAPNTFEPTYAYPSSSNDKSDDDLVVPLTQEELPTHETTPQIPNCLS